jgi:hypothetical protein
MIVANPTISRFIKRRLFPVTREDQKIAQFGLCSSFVAVGYGVHFQRLKSKVRCPRVTEAASRRVMPYGMRLRLDSYFG